MTQPLSDGRGSDSAGASGLVFAAAAFTVVGLALSCALALLSDGVYHDDDLTHFLFAQWSWSDPRFLLDEWGRPGFTALYALPARFGWTAARLFSGVLTAATAWLTYDLGRRAGLRGAWLVPALLWLQPLTFSLSYTTLTEPVLALYLAAAAWLLAGRRFAAGAAVLSLCFVTRHEAGVFLPLWIVATWTQPRAPRSWPLVLWAPLLHNVLAALFLDRIPALMFLQPKPTDYYQPGGWLSMTLAWIACAGPGLLMLAAAGGASLRTATVRARLRPTRRGSELGRQSSGAGVPACPAGTEARPTRLFPKLSGTPLDECESPIAAVRFLLLSGIAYFLAHTLIHRFGLFASGGYARFLVPLGPVVALCAAEALARFAKAARPAAHWLHAAGAVRAAFAVSVACVVLWIAAEVHYPQWLWWGLRWPVLLLAVVTGLGAIVKSPAPRAVAVSLLPAYLACAAIGQPLRQCTPHRLSEDQWMVREAATWLRERDLHQRNIYTANVWLDWFLGIRRGYDRPRLRDVPELMRPGDLLVWDARYCSQPPNELPLAAVRSRGDMVELWHGGVHSRDGIYCYVFEKRQPTAATTQSHAVQTRPTDVP